MSFKPVEKPVVTLPLERPIQAMGDQISEIAIREPTAGDIFRCGNPVLNFDFGTGRFSFDEKKAMAMLSRLSGIPIEGSLERMTAEDAVDCFEALGPFFVKGLRKALLSYQAAKEAETLLLSSKKQDEPPAN